MEENQIKYYHLDNQKFNDEYVTIRKTLLELKKEKELTNLILAFYKKVYNNDIKKISWNLFDLDFRHYGFKKGIGYYLAIHDDPGYCMVKTYGNNIEEAFIDIVNNLINKRIHIDEFQDNLKTKKESRERFPKIKKAKEIIHVEYALNKWSIFYDKIIPHKVMEIYEKYIELISNHQKEPVHFAYDNEIAQITYKKKNKTKKLIKN